MGNAEKVGIILSLPKEVRFLKTSDGSLTANVLNYFFVCNYKHSTNMPTSFKIYLGYSSIE